MNPWFKPLKSIIPYIFRISTPYGSGTGFQILYSQAEGFCGIATAYHIIKRAYEWEENIKITHHSSNKTIVLRKGDRAIFLYPEKDLAFILFRKNELPIETSEPTLIDSSKAARQGVEIAWCGFPAIAPPAELCLFVGHVSCFLQKQDSYLVDGVAINGVSGGPAFYIGTETGDSKICGVITAYMPNRATGEILPGLCIVRPVEPYQDTFKNIRSFLDAQQKAKEQQKEAQKIALDDEEKKPSKAKEGKIDEKKAIAD